MHIPIFDNLRLITLLYFPLVCEEWNILSSLFMISRGLTAMTWFAMLSTIFTIRRYWRVVFLFLHFSVYIIAKTALDLTHSLLLRAAPVHNGKDIFEDNPNLIKIICLFYFIILFSDTLTTSRMELRQGSYFQPTNQRWAY